MIGTYIANMPKNTVFFIVKYRIYPIYFSHPFIENCSMLGEGLAPRR